MAENHGLKILEMISGKARIIDLEHERFPGMPAFDPVKPAMEYFLYRQHENYYSSSPQNRRSSSSGLIVMTDQSGTHLDALCHQAYDMKMFDGTPINSEVETPWGFNKHDSSKIPPIIRKGILIDCTEILGDPLPENHEVSLEEFQKVAKKEGVSFGKEDVILVRTGYGKYWNDFSRYRNAAGISGEVSKYLSERCFAVGADNLAWDVPGKVDRETGVIQPGHLHLIAKNGVYIMENLFLEELAKAKTYEFLFIALPLKMRGTTGTPIRPVAII
ncbi:MAG: cyclase family protein [Candidatus Thermoplasmatota archaeon]|jgi:kynurenine formamidase|nr:cyclase family protein [Candidatus Thermoplasmatota archaeon]